MRRFLLRLVMVAVLGAAVAGGGLAWFGMQISEDAGGEVQPAGVGDTALVRERLGTLFGGVLAEAPLDGMLQRKDAGSARLVVLVLLATPLPSGLVLVPDEAAAVASRLARRDFPDVMPDESEAAASVKEFQDSGRIEATVFAFDSGAAYLYLIED